MSEKKPAQTPNQKNLRRVLESYGISTQNYQPHLAGERFLHSPNKYVLIGEEIKTGGKVIAKISSVSEGRKEIVDEYKKYIFLSGIDNKFELPKLIKHKDIGDLTFSVFEYIEQDESIFSLNDEKQFTKVVEILSIFHQASDEMKTREGFGNFEIMTTGDYISKINSLKGDLYHADNESLFLFNSVRKEFTENVGIINLFCGFITHNDFAPHNVRLTGGKIYLLDLNSVYIGNKHDHWARFLNYLVTYNYKTVKRVEGWLKGSVSEQEYTCFTLMRAFRLLNLIHFHSSLLQKAGGNLHILTKKRIELWKYVLKQLLRNQNVSQQYLNQYILDRDALRSANEVARLQETIL